MKQAWWKEGIQFQCQGSGKCCVSRGQYGYVYLTLEDRRRFAKYFGLATAKFTREFCQKDDNGYFHLTGFESACRFLENNRCSVYEARPTQCRTWPFWPETLSAKSWQREVAAYCPGVGKGKTWSRAEIEEQLQAQLKSETSY
jgi:Fe-S-cluster containining protein